jgi:serine/threonine protein kinase
MGEVYRARDTRLGREVAIKVLPPDVASEPVRLERFSREARAAAALNHPNILAVHDVSSAGEVHYLVSELLEGQTLADRLQLGNLSVRKAIDLAQQAALGLAAAHARGIVHRDLKPGNLFITSDGRLKILDFGLAKQAVVPEGGVTATAHLPQTNAGQVMGTVGYMAPEQLRAQTVDARADIFAFGAVLYEMLAGRRAFHADTAADTISAILGVDPPDLLSTPEHAIPPALHRIVSRCLEKDPAARFQSAADLAFALQSLTSESAAPLQNVPATVARNEPRAGSRWREWAWPAVAFGALAVAGWARLSQPITDPVGPPAVEFSVQLPLETATALSRVSLSPDGRWLLLFSAAQPWLRSMMDGRTERLPTPAGQSTGSLWAPDSSSFAYVAGERLVQLRLSDRSTTDLAEVGPLSFPITGDRTADGEAVVADTEGRIVAVSTRTPSGSKRVLHDGDGVPRRIVGFLPRSRTFFVVVDSSTPDASGLFRGTFDSSALLRIDSNRWDSGAVVDATTLLLKRETGIYELQVAADGTRVERQARLLTSAAPVTFLGWTATRNGVFAYVSIVPNRFRWLDASGRLVGTVGSAASWSAFAMDRGGKRVVASRASPDPRFQDLWTIDTDSGIEERLTFTDERDSDPAVDADGRRVIFVSGGALNRTTTAFAIQQGQPPEKLFEDSAGVVLDDWSPDGRWVVYHHRVGMPGAQGGTLLMRDLQASAAAGRPIARCQGGRSDEARISPDGRWLAFNCDETGRHEIYVVPFPGGGDRVRVSREGGVQPAWRGDSRQLYFLAPEGTMMSSAVTPGSVFQVDAARALFKTDLRPNFQMEQYRVTADGRRFLLQLPETDAPPLTVIVNWRERFKSEP